MADDTVVVTDHFFEDLSVEREYLEGTAAVEELDADDPTERRRQLASADALLVSQFEVDADVIADLDHCAVVSRYGIGVDNVDVEAATERGIHVGNAPTYGVEEVAVHTVALLLNLARRVKPIDDVVGGGGWREAPPTFRRGDGTAVDLPIHRFSTATVGFVGFGNIGRAVAERLGGFDVNLLVADPYLDPADVAEYGADLVGFDEVIDRADYVTIHSPLTEETRDRFDVEVFERMKETAVLVNCARGPIVDTDALVAAVEGGEIRSAALDVFATEPLPDDHPVRDHDRVLTTPHVAYYSEESDEHRRRQAVENVRAVLEGDSPVYPVNDV
ncbi:MAG: C-terminal binding protein [Halorhabdus sp.]